MEMETFEISNHEALECVARLRAMIQRSGRTAVTRGLVRSISPDQYPPRAGAILKKLVQLGIMEYGPSDGGQKTFRFKPEHSTASPSASSVTDAGTIDHMDSTTSSKLRERFLLTVPDPHVGMVVSTHTVQALGDPFSQYTRNALSAVLRGLGAGGKVQWSGNVRVLTSAGLRDCLEFRRSSGLSSESSAPPKKTVPQLPKAPTPRRPTAQPPASPPLPPPPPPPPEPSPPPTVQVKSLWDNKRLRPTLETFAFLAEWAKRKGVRHFNEDTLPKDLVYPMGYTSLRCALQSARSLAWKGQVFDFLGGGTTLVFRADFLQEATARGLLGDCPDNSLISPPVAG